MKVTKLSVADLHIHTTVSDGMLFPEEVVIQASKAGLKAIAITDHDTTDGIIDALKMGNKLNLEVIPGVEINTEYNNREIHILGYFMNYNLNWFQELLKKLRSEREQRAKKILDLLAKIGKPIDRTKLMETAKASSSIGRPHIAKCLVEAGYVSTTREAFETLIGRGKPAYVPRFKLTPQEAIKYIKQAGGVAVLAHPGESIDLKCFAYLIQNGLLGLEAVHHEHSVELESKLKSLANKYNLAITGGSDFHGGGRAGGPKIGSKTVPYSYVEKIKTLSQQIKVNR